MKIKEVDRTANTAWSPKSCYPIYLAAGTAAQQVDSSFSTTSTLELYEFDVNSSGLDMPLKASLNCENRFHKLVWGSHGMGTEDKDKHASGILVGGCDGGIMEVYDAAKIMEGDEQPLVLSKNKHTGAVKALDFNSFRSYLIASGASDSEILIWDLNNPKTPMSPGAKAQPPDDVTCLAWNKQVEHILASTFSTRCVVWDLRKNEPIIKLADATARIRYKVVAWHPAVATQMCLASEEDSNPVIQLWDLRYATSPLKTMQGHERGVLGLAWCQDDPELLLSCGKDNRIHCWNPNYPHPGYEMVCDIPTSCQWSFDVSFCPRNPVVISTSSFDGRISVYGLSGGSQQPVTTSKLADSFPGMDMDINHTPVPAQKPAAVHLRDAPKWLKRPCGASFGFGGKLIQYENVKHPAGSGAGDVPDQRIVKVSQIVTLPEFIARSQILEQALESGSLTEFCQGKALKASEPSEAKIWEFLGASFLGNPNQAYLNMLGFDPESIQTKRKQLISTSVQEGVDTITDGFVSLGGRGVPDGFGQQSQLTAPSENGSAFDTFSQTSTRSVTPEPEKLFPILTDETTEGLLNQALICGNLEFAVDLCLKDCRWADALILASTGGPELIKKAQIKYFHKCENETSNMVRAVVTRDLRRLVDKCDLECWKQALATVLTYADQSEFPLLAEILGRRLEMSRGKNDELRKSALLCYICSGNMNRLAESWGSKDESADEIKPDELQDIVEQVMILRKASEYQGKGIPPISAPLATKLVEYAAILVSQGCLQSSLQYINDATEPSMINLKERVYYSLGLSIAPTQTRQSQFSPVRHPRSRQTSESSGGPRHAVLAKRPSYPSSQQQSPAMMASSLFDSRRMSGMNDGLNISALTGPVQPPPIQTSYDNPYGQQNQQPSSLLMYSSQNQNQSFQPSAFSPVAQLERKASMSGLPPPPPAAAPVAHHGWNDPPMLPPKPMNPMYSIAPQSTMGMFQPSMPQSHFPPPPSSSFGPPPPSSSSFGPPPPSSLSFGPPPQQHQQQSYDPSHSQNYQTPQHSHPMSSLPPPPPKKNIPESYAPEQQSYNPYNPQQLNYQNQPSQQLPPPTSAAGSLFTPGSGVADKKPMIPGMIAPPPVSSAAHGWNDPPLFAQKQIPSMPPSSMSFSSGLGIQQASLHPVQSLAHSLGPQIPSVSTYQSAPPMAPTPVSSYQSAPPMAPTPVSSYQSAPPMAPTPVSSYQSAPPMAPTPVSSYQSAPPRAPTPVSSYQSAPPMEPSSDSSYQSAPPLAPVPLSTYQSPLPMAPTSAPPGPPPVSTYQSPMPPTSAPPVTSYQSQQKQQLPEPSALPMMPTAPPVSSFDQPFAPPQPSLQNVSLPPMSFNASSAPVAKKTPAPTPEPTKTKGPIPSEHEDLADTFEKLRNECCTRTSQPHMKRKLEDVGRKLDLLSDKLRDGALSAKTLTILHNMIGTIKNQDYKSALEAHTQLVTAGNFAEISSFAPAIKILIQTASQLGVFI